MSEKINDQSFSKDNNMSTRIRPLPTNTSSDSDTPDKFLEKMKHTMSKKKNNYKNIPELTNIYDKVAIGSLSGETMAKNHMRKDDISNDMALNPEIKSLSEKLDKKTSESLKNMNNTNVRELHNDIRREQTSPPIIEFTIYRTPASDRLIANVTRLIWNGVDLLSGHNIMLYESSGESRGTGLGGIWLPYMGEAIGRLVKLEDEYIKALDSIITYNSIGHYRTLLIDIIRNITSYKYYMRFINKSYLVASFLLNLKYQEYISNPANQEHIRKYLRIYTDEEKQNAKIHLMNKTIRNSESNPQNYYIPITIELIDEIIQPVPQSGGGNKYYEKYIKYKNKYAMLKNFVLQHKA